MPLVIHPRVRKFLARATGVLCLVMFGSTGAALAAWAPGTGACGAQAVSTPFAQYGDDSEYFLVPGGTFSAPGDPLGWSLTDAFVTPAAEAGDDGSLTIDAGGSATSPYVCMDNTMPSLRFVAQQLSPGGDLTVQALVNFGNRPRVFPIATIADGTMQALAPVSSIALPGNVRLPSWASLQVALRFTVTGGSWLISDVYVDPYRTG